MRRLEAQHLDAAALTLALAFHDDPMSRILEPDAAKRDALGQWFFGTFLKYSLPFGEVWGTEDASAVAVWLPPGKTDLSTIGMMRAGLAALPLKVGLQGSMRVMRALSVTEPFHKAVEGPHWYLGLLGTRPALQGQGLGKELLTMGLDKADAAGLPCYLETGTQENVDFYSRRGFEVTGEVEAEGFPVWAMVRPPQTPTE